MKRIYIVYCCDDDLGEVEAVFDDKGELLSAWSCNDASWREYFNPFMMRLGIEVRTRRPTEEEIKLLMKYFGV